MSAKEDIEGDRAKAMALFVAVVEEGSFSAAGRTFGLTPSSVSRAIDRTENRLGVRLFLRSTRSLELTAEGEAYLSASRRILSDIAYSEQALADLGSPKGRLRVSTAQAYGRQHIVPLLGGFLARYPDILVEIELSDRVVDIARGEADVAIRFGPLPDSNLTARKLGESKRVVVASPDYLAREGTPQHPNDLKRHNCMNFTFRRAEPVWPFKADGTDLVMDVSGNVEANTGETLAQLACDGVGIARVGAFSVEREIENGKLVAILEDFNPGDKEAINAVFVGGDNMPARLRVFVDYLAECLR